MAPSFPILVLPLGSNVTGAEGAAADEVSLAGLTYLVDPPMCGIAPPHAKRVFIAEQCGDAAERVRRLDLQRPAGFD